MIKNNFGKIRLNVLVLKLILFYFFSFIILLLCCDHILFMLSHVKLILIRDGNKSLDIFQKSIVFTKSKINNF